MMLARVALGAVLLATAPIQCGHTPDAELREDETPGDALWRLSQKFHDAGDVRAERETLQYLVDRYPASRWVGPAHDELAHLGAAPDGGA